MAIYTLKAAWERVNEMMRVKAQGDHLRPTKQWNSQKSLTQKNAHALSTIISGGGPRMKMKNSHRPKKNSVENT